MNQHQTPLIPFFRRALLLGSVALLPLAAQSASVTWGGPQAITGTSDVSTAGTLVGAANVGDIGVASTTVNGVNFQSLAAPAGNGTAGIFAIATAGGGSADNTGGSSANAPFATLAATYQTLLSSFVGSVNSSTITISGLVVGAQYQFQVWTNRSGIAFDNQLFLDAGNSLVLSANPNQMDGGLGQWAIGTFTADAMTQTITFGGDGEVRGLVNGFQLRNITQVPGVPENGRTLPLLAVALAAIGLARRKLCRG
jgi:hypothetical protein